MLVSVSKSLPSEGQREMQQTTKTYRITHLVMGTRSLKLKLRIEVNRPPGITENIRLSITPKLIMLIITIF